MSEPDDDGDSCDLCGGMGVNPASEPCICRLPCPTCGGSGYDERSIHDSVFDPCLSCEGRQTALAARRVAERKDWWGR